MERIQQLLKEYPNDLLEYVTVPLLRDIAFSLVGQEPLDSDRTILAPFALVPREVGSGAILAQFRFERIRRLIEEPSAECRMYLAPEQMFLRMDRSFHESVFKAAHRAVSELVAGDDHACSNCDIRVRIERFDTQNTDTATGLFDPYVQMNDRKGELFDEPLMGRSASGAAAWGLYFVRTAKVPDPGLIVLAQVDDLQGVYSLEDGNQHVGQRAGLLKEKVRRIAESGLFDTIAVTGQNNLSDAKAAIEEAAKGDSIKVANIEDVDVCHA
jgi:hypothetical protein